MGVSKLFKYTYNKLLIIVISPVIIWAVMITSATNLNHSFGLTPIDFNHIGYYDHVSDIYDSILQDGNKEIFDYLLQNNKNRVVAMANMPQCFSFRCNVQSYRDIVGDGGNPSIVTSIDSFKQFLNYAKTDYIYTEKQFLVSGSRQEELIRCMVIEGSLKEYIYEDDNVLYIYVRR